MMKRISPYLYNITCHMSRRVSPQVEAYLQQEFLPQCLALPSVLDARLLRILSDELDGVAMAIHVELSDLGPLAQLATWSQQMITKVEGVTPEELMTFPTLMKSLDSPEANR